MPTPKLTAFVGGNRREQHISYSPLRISKVALLFFCWVWVWCRIPDVRVRDGFVLY